MKWWERPKDWIFGNYLLNFNARKVVFCYSFFCVSPLFYLFCLMGFYFKVNFLNAFFKIIWYRGSLDFLIMVAKNGKKNHQEIFTSLLKGWKSLPFEQKNHGEVKILIQTFARIKRQQNEYISLCWNASIYIEQSLEMPMWFCLSLWLKWANHYNKI